MNKLTRPSANYIPSIWELKKYNNGGNRLNKEYVANIDNSTSESFSFGIPNNTIIKYGNMLRLDNTILKDGDSVYLNKDGSFTFKDSGIYMVITKGHYHIQDDSDNFTSTLKMEINSNRQKYAIYDIEIDSNTINTVQDITFLKVTNGETFYIINKTGEELKIKENINVIFHGMETPLQVSILKL